MSYVIRLHNSATGRIEELHPVIPGTVSMYVCGPTVYDVPHIGHGRFVLVFDILRRYLQHLGLTVVHVSNITDVDDKILKRAAEEGREPWEVAATYEGVWWDTLEALDVLRPNHVPHATDYIPKMIEFISTLVEAGKAYVSSDGVYFDVSTVADYGLLAHQSLESLRSGARVEANENKRSQLDFALWKLTPEDRWAWDSPWGRGRPGWHTECVVMSEDLLGKSFDIHGGGSDLMFPHHENERAQASCLGHPFAHIWVHNGFLVAGTEKMSKSLGNFITLPELVGSNDPRAYRLLVLQAHYRSPLAVSVELAADGARALARIDQALARLDAEGLAGAEPDAQVMAAFHEAMDDDLDTPAATALLFQSVTRLNSLIDQGERDSAAAIGAAVSTVFGVLGLSARTAAGEVPAEVADLFARRERARADRDYALSDTLRDQLVDLGWVVEDAKGGGVLKPRLP